MRHLFRSIVVRALIYSAAFALLIGAARAIGSAQPPPEALDTLHLTDCQLPCWIGIIPGTTTLREAAQFLQAADPQTKLLEKDTLHGVFLIESTHDEVEIDTDNAGFIHEITVYTPESSGIKLGDVVNLLGVPICIGRSPNPFPVYGTSPLGFSYAAQQGNDGRAWFAPFNSLEIFDDAQNPCFIKDRPRP